MSQRLDIEIAKFEIETDNSLLPFKDIETATGGMLNGVARTYNLSPLEQRFAVFVLQKSPSKYKYERHFHKLDETLSYAGGLIGVVVGLFFIMSPYTELCYELSLANQLFTD